MSSSRCNAAGSTSALLSLSRLSTGAWKDARHAKAHQHWEAVFNRIVWREGFEEHLCELARAATAEPDPVPA
jgi:hypothetical protein